MYKQMKENPWATVLCFSFWNGSIYVCKYTYITYKCDISIYTYATILNKKQKPRQFS